MFFCAGFFTATSVKSSDSTLFSNDSKLPISEIGELVDVTSSTISDKIKTMMLNSDNGTTEQKNHAVSDKKNVNEKDTIEKKHICNSNAELTINSLLREIAATHSMDDNCSIEDTEQKLMDPISENTNSLYGKKIVFIGYFKNNIALQVHKLLASKGYNVHVERSKTSTGDESFVFCGPFKKDINANKLVEWLHLHNFSEARLIKISDNAFEDTLYDFVNDESSIPSNVEKDIPEMQIEAQQEMSNYDLEKLSAELTQDEMMLLKQELRKVSQKKKNK